MANIYNIDEVFEIGEQIERNGRRFYLRAAEQCEDADLKDLLARLADMEADHEALFARMRKEIAADGGPQVEFDPDHEVALYLQASAETHVFNVHQDLAATLGGDESPEDVLRLAIAFEKDTVIFFLGMKDAVPEDLGRGKMDWLVQQEKQHIVELAARLRAL